tara:strand:- start:751 stop:876 length:126 start_codon:yes stop_codon:yes gene_type:complete
MSEKLQALERAWSRHPCLRLGLDVVFYALSTLALLALSFGR